MAPHSNRSPARFLAPLALIAFAVALFVVIGGLGLGGGGGDEGGGAAPPAATTRPQQRTTTQRAELRREPATYTVEVGDTLGAIAEETGVAVERIEELNPELDPQALVAGQEIQLRE